VDGAMMIAGESVVSKIQSAFMSEKKVATLQSFITKS
jgi:hypothetical protein